VVNDAEHRWREYVDARCVTPALVELDATGHWVHSSIRMAFYVRIS
jgi:hypothetical protein